MGHFSDETEGNRSSVFSFFIGVNDGLDTYAWIRFCTLDGRRYSLCICCSYIKHLGTTLQLAIVSISSYATIVLVGKSATVVVLDNQSCNLVSLFRNEAIGCCGNYLEGIVLGSN